jgi:hypothetical protein
MIVRVYVFAVYHLEEEEEEEQKKKKNRCMYVRHTGTGSQNSKTYAVGDRLYISNFFLSVMDRTTIDK